MFASVPSEPPNVEMTKFTVADATLLYVRLWVGLFGDEFECWDSLGFESLSDCSSVVLCCVGSLDCGMSGFVSLTLIL